MAKETVKKEEVKSVVVARTSNGRTSKYEALEYPKHLGFTIEEVLMQLSLFSKYGLSSIKKAIDEKDPKLLKLISSFSDTEGFKKECLSWADSRKTVKAANKGSGTRGKISYKENYTNLLSKYDYLKALYLEIGSSYNILRAASPAAESLPEADMTIFNDEGVQTDMTVQST